MGTMSRRKVTRPLRLPDGDLGVDLRADSSRFARASAKIALGLGQAGVDGAHAHVGGRVVALDQREDARREDAG